MTQFSLSRNYQQVSLAMCSLRRLFGHVNRTQPPVTLFDTAQVHRLVANEDLVGEALAPFRGQGVIAT